MVRLQHSYYSSPLPELTIWHVLGGSHYDQSRNLVPGSTLVGLPPDTRVVRDGI